MPARSPPARVPARRPKPRDPPAPIPASEMRRLEANAAELGVGEARLMANAGRALADAVSAAARGSARRGKAGGLGTILVLCGKGNNGGDGLAAACLLLDAGHDVQVVHAQRPRPAGAREAKVPRRPRDGWAARFPRERQHLWTGRAESSWNQATVIVDALLGTGSDGSGPRPPYDALVRWLARRHEAGARVVACDVPTGFGSPLVAPADVTVAFHAPKAEPAGATTTPSAARSAAPSAATSAATSRLVVADIGIPAAARGVGLGDLVQAYRIPRPGSHKGDNGTVHVVAGGPFTGAPRYVAMGAYRSGADLVHVHTPEAAAPLVQAYGPEPMVHAAGPGATLGPKTLDALRPWLVRRDATAWVVGPGVGTAKATRKACAEVLAAVADLGAPVVVDADGLDALAPKLMARHGASMVLTPHSREFQDLAGVAPTRRSVSAYAVEHGVTVLWKHQGTTVAAADGRIRDCARGHPTMTVGGTGDVLAGAVAALLAKGAEPFEAACAGSYLVGCAGEVAAGLRSWGATAVDVHEAIPAVLLRLAPW